MPEAAALSFDEIDIGREASFEVEFTDELVGTFARMSGDWNPLHMDERYASATQFKGKIAHGAAVASFFSTLVGMHLPGKFALYLSQTTNFRAPVRIGTRIRIRGVVVQKTEPTRTLSIRTTAEDQVSSEVFIDGTALVQVLK